MIEPKEVEIETADGGKRSYTISKFPAVAGREIITQYPISGIPKLGDYDTNEKIMMQILGFVSVQPTEGPAILLSSRALIDNHVPEWETLARLEWAMMEYNISFFREGRVSGFLDDLMEKLPESILSMLTPLLEQLSPKSTPPSEN